MGIHGLHRQREWDEVVVTDVAPSWLPPGSELTLVALAVGRVVVEDGPAATAPEELVAGLRTAPPYRARVVSRSDGRLGVAARRIDVARLPVDPGGDDVELAWDGVERVVRVDGEPSPADVTALDALGSARHRTYVVGAHRLDGDLWEVDVTPL